MLRTALLYLTALGALLTGGMISPEMAFAQPVLVAASPAPDAVLTIPPSEVRLEFDRAIASEDVLLSVLDAQGNSVTAELPHFRQSERYVITLPLPSLPNGIYTVRYRVQSIGGSPLVEGVYQFTLALPPPRLLMVAPVDGQAFEQGAIEVRFRTEAVDFALYDTRIRLYVDDAPITELRTLSYMLEGLGSGVHEIRAVLERSGEELPETTNVAYIALAQPDQEYSGRITAALAPPDSGLILPPWVLVGTVLLTLILLVVGYLLGRAVPPSGV